MDDYKIYSYLFDYTKELAESWLKTNMVGSPPVDTLLGIPMIMYLHREHKVDDLVEHLSEVLEVSLGVHAYHPVSTTLDAIITELLSQKHPALYKVKRLEKVGW